MNRNILNKEKAQHSFYKEFKDEKMDSAELFDVLGGVEKSGDYLIEDLQLDHFTFDHLIPDWKIKETDKVHSTGMKPYLSKKTDYSFIVRFFRTLHYYVCLRLKK